MTQKNGDPRYTGATAAQIRAEGDRLARIDLGLPPLPSPGPGMNGGYQVGPPRPKTAEQVSAEHSQFIVDLLIGARRR
jgi:hypothetical protein